MKQVKLKTRIKEIGMLALLLLLGTAATLYALQAQHQPKAKQQRQSKQTVKGTHVQPAEQRNMWQQRRAKSWKTEHRSWQQRGGYSGYRIPSKRFRGQFGRNHGFRISTRTVLIYGGHPRFLHNGYWFSMIEPWPEYWSDDWYENDDVYIVSADGGYYLYNHRHPSDGITINVSIN